MRRSLLSAVHVVGLLMLVGTSARAQCVTGGLAVIVNKANPTESLSVAQLRKLMLGDIRTWPDKRPVMLVSREASSDVFKCVLSSIVRMNDAEYRRYIVNAEFRGGDPLAIRTVGSGPDAAKVIAGMAGSIMVIQTSELASLIGTTRVVRVNGKEPGEAGYPF